MTATRLRSRGVRFPDRAGDRGTLAAQLVGAHACRGRREVLHDVDLDVRFGEVLCVVGPNGAGKSTVVALLAGDLAPSAGQVLLDGEPIGRWSARELALRRSVLPQQAAVAFGFSAADVVRMGRSPWAGTPRAGEDDQHVEAALAAVGASALTHRPVTALSGGEQARVHLARTFAQDTDLVLLDEPTAALDLRHAEALLRHARRLAVGGRAVVVVVHALDLAAAYADRVALLRKGRLAADGPPDSVLTTDLLSEAYDYDVEVLVHPRTGRPLVLPTRDPAR
jgi:iron complex transport system ATP-binding protein